MAQNASQRSLFRICIVFALDFSKDKESALSRITPLTFFLAGVRVPVHILEFFNTSPVRIVFSVAKTEKVLAPFALFTSGTKNATIIFASSILNEKPCIILTVLSRSWVPRLRRAKPTREQPFFCSFKILPPSKIGFSLKDSHQMAKVASPR